MLADEEFDVLADFLVLVRLANAFNDLGGRGSADISQIELFFESGKERLIDTVIAREQPDHTGEDRGGFLETGFELGQQSTQHANPITINKLDGTLIWRFLVV